jgi:glycosyltransferase involved in cell wall biosynthesis
MAGGAEALAEALVRALAAAGHRAELVRLPFFPKPPEHVIQAMQMARMMEIGETNAGPIDRLIALKFPAYLIEHPAKVLWLVHQYRQLFDLWHEPGVGFEHLPVGSQLRDAVSRAERRYLPHARKRFGISRLVCDRLQVTCGIDAETLYPPLPDPNGYQTAPAEDYFLFPGLVTRLKRQHLVLDALGRTRTPVQVRFIGATVDGEVVAEFHAQVAALGLGDRARHLGWVSESAKRDLYARSLGVIFPPRLEDLGLVVQEAMASAKPIVTCRDSGGVLEFVTDGENGIVSDPSPEVLADALDQLWADRARAKRLGQAGFDRLNAMNLSWSHVVDRLLE